MTNLIAGASACLNGIPVYESNLIAPKPVLRLTEEVLISDSFRAEFNDWLLQKFGKTYPAIVTGAGIFMHPIAFRQLKKEIIK